MLIQGSIKLSRPLEENACKLLNALAETPRYARDVTVIGTGFGVEGEFYTAEEMESALVPHRPPVSQPTEQLDWFISEDGTELFYDEAAEIPVNAHKWLRYLITKFFQPKGIVLNGKMRFSRPSDDAEILVIEVKNNQIEVL